MKNVAIVGGNWQSNQGNAFYNIGMFVMLQKIHDLVPVLVEDPPEFFDLNLSGGRRQFSELVTDHVVFSGPCLGLTYLSTIEDICCDLAERNITVSFHSVGLTKYNLCRSEGVRIAAILRRIEPQLISTRDRLTYDFLAGLGLSIPLEDGICTSAFLQELRESLPTFKSGKTRIILNTSLSVKRQLVRSGDLNRIIEDLAIGDSISGGRVELITTTTNPSSAELPFKYLNRALVRFYGSRVRQVRRNFDFYSDNPLVSLALYKSADLVISDRVHVCAAALALGSSARYLATDARSRDGRSALLTRLGHADIHNIAVQPLPALATAEVDLMRDRFAQMIF